MSVNSKVTVPVGQLATGPSKQQSRRDTIRCQALPGGAGSAARTLPNAGAGDFLVVGRWTDDSVSCCASLCLGR